MRLTFTKGDGIAKRPLCVKMLSSLAASPWPENTPKIAEITISDLTKIYIHGIRSWVKNECTAT